MKSLLSAAALLIVLAIVGLSVRSQLRVTEAALPPSAGASSGTAGAAGSPDVVRLRQELGKAMRGADDRAAGAGDAADAAR